MFDSLNNPRLGNYYGANALMSRGADTFTGAVNTYGARVAKRAENAALQELMGQGIGEGQSGLDYRTSLMGAAGNISDLNAKTGLEAIGLMSSPYIDQGNKDRSYGLDQQRVGIAGGNLAERRRHNKFMEENPNAGKRNRLDSGQDDFGTPYIIDLDSGTVNYNLKSAANTVTPTSTEPTTQYAQNAQETIIDPPQDVGVAGWDYEKDGFDAEGAQTGAHKLRGSDSITYDQGGSGRRYYEHGVVATPPKHRKMVKVPQGDGSSRNVVIDERTGRAINPAEEKMLNQPVQDKLSTTIELPSGDNVYVDRQGTPIRNAQGQYLVKSRSKEGAEKAETNKGIANTMRSLDNIISRVQSNPESVGSIGSDFGNWVGNQINDIIKAPTGTRLNRNQIEAKGGVIAAGLRKGVESGVMTQPDFERYMKLVPDVNDSPQEAVYKGQQLMNTLFQQYGVVPLGYKKQYNDETGERRIIKKAGGQ